MIRIALICVWICGVTVGAAYFGARWQPGAESQGDANDKPLGKLIQLKLKPLNVPVLSGDKVAGYIVCQMAVMAVAETLKKLPVKPDVFILDAAYKAIYTGRGLDITRIGKESWSEFAKTVKDAVNSRYGAEVLHEVLIEEFGYVPSDVARKGGERAHSAPAKSDGAGTEKKRKEH